MLLESGASLAFGNPEGRPPDATLIGAILEERDRKRQEQLELIMDPVLRQQAEEKSHDNIRLVVWIQSGNQNHSKHTP